MIEADAVACSRAILLHLQSWFAAHPDWKRVATFFPLPGEPDLTTLHRVLADRLWAYPRIDGSEMTFHSIVDPTQELVKGRWNLHEPHSASLLVPRNEIDVMLCPGVAFDIKGRRLGKGKGFYDRYLSADHTHRPYLIGVTFATHLLENIPAEPHDIAMDGIVTEHGLTPLG